MPHREPGVKLSVAALDALTIQYRISLVNLIDNRIC